MSGTVSYYAPIGSYTSILQIGEETYGQCSGCCVAMKTLQESLQYVHTLLIPYGRYIVKNLMFSGLPLLNLAT